MDVTSLEWIVTMVVTIVILVFDVGWIARRPHEPSMRECVGALAAYTTLAIGFAGFVWFRHGGTYGMEFVAGWITEYSLSIDNLFIFVVIMASFNVPRVYQQQALMVGIILALVLRAIFIAVGAAAIEHFTWVFYVFGIFLLITAVRLAGSLRADAHSTKKQHAPPEAAASREPDGDGNDGNNLAVRAARRILPMTDQWSGLRLWARQNRRIVITPMFLVILALGSTDVLFALDSIPAIFGLTHEPYLVFTANIFALMGLRQLYFLLGNLLLRLVYLSVGLAVILGFISIKLILHALSNNDLAFINNGDGVRVPEISTTWSLLVIIAILIITALASMARTRRPGPR